MAKILIAALLVIAGFNADASAQMVCRNGRCVRAGGLLDRAVYRPQPRRVRHSEPTPAATVQLAEGESIVSATADPPLPEYSTVESYEVTHAGPFCRNGRWYPGKAIVRGAKAVGRVWFPGKYAAKAVRGVRSRRSCR